MFRLVKSETKNLTPELAIAFHNMKASPTERAFDPQRARMLREKAQAGQLIAMQWATAQLGNEEYRMNGQHSSAVLTELGEAFPKGLVAHIDHYEVDNKDGLALLFRQFDARKSGRTPSDVSGAYQGLYDSLHDVPRGEAKLAVEGCNWYRKNVEGLPFAKGDDVYSLFGELPLHNYIRWIGDVLNVKTPELKRIPIAAAMYGCFLANETKAREFWGHVGRGGVQFEDQNPSTALDNFLKGVMTKESYSPANAAEIYQACVYSWKAYNEGKTLASVKYDVRKGLHSIAA
jgi:hypothetical protein